MIMTGSHDSVLVAISISIAIAASYTALDLAGRIRASEGWLRRVWLATAAIAMGGGIWAMHFVAMLAFSMPGMEVGYDVQLTIVSLLVAIVVTGAGFVVMSRSRGALAPLLVAGVFMGLGIVAMHYIGMAAMQMPAALRYDRLWLAISVLIAVGAATAALWLASRESHLVVRFGAAAMMGAAIAGMHFAGMRAAIFTMVPGFDMARGNSSVSQSMLAIGVSTAAFLILFLSLIAAMFDRRFAVLVQREAEVLRQSEERFRSLYKRTPLPLHALDRFGLIEHVSDAWLDLMGYAREEVIGRPFINFLTEASARQFLQDWPELLRQGSLGPCEYRAVTRDGAFLDLVSAAKVERDSAEELLHVVGGLTDVTGRRRAEEALRQAQKLETMGQLTGGIAHDFNNLLAVILGNLELLRKRLPEDPKALRLLESAYQGAERGASLTQRLLAFARRQDLRPQPVDIPALVQGMTNLLQRSLGPRVQIETHFPLGLPFARVDAHQLEMALLNLAVNARDAMPDGGVVDISASEALLAGGEVDDLPAGRYVRLTFADTGAGMDEETLARATDPFFTTKGVGQGTGLGLSMVQGLAAQSGGWLALRSVVGRGTTAELYLPFAERPARRKPEPARPDETPTKLPAMTILVVDDDPLVLANTAAMLEDLGATVMMASSGGGALAEVQRGGIDLVVADQLMPQMTGLELAEAIRKDCPGLPLLLVSGFANLDRDAVKDIHVLAKPFTQEALARAVRMVKVSASVIPIKQPRTRTSEGGGASES
jgi:PAS domain S-box-containing protein